MVSATMYREQDIYADDVSRILTEQGLLEEDSREEMKRFLRGW